MTREEAIKCIHEEKLRYERAPWLNGCPMTEEWQKAIDICDMVISALRAQQVQESKPLTLDELRHMDGEPVWIVWLDGRINSKWWIVGNYDWHMMEFDDDYERYGKTWLAYSHQLKNTTEG